MTPWPSRSRSPSERRGGRFRLAVTRSGPSRRTSAACSRVERASGSRASVRTLCPEHAFSADMRMNTASTLTTGWKRLGASAAAPRSTPGSCPTGPAPTRPESLGGVRPVSRISQPRNMRQALTDSRQGRAATRETRLGAPRHAPETPRCGAAAFGNPTVSFWCTDLRRRSALRPLAGSRALDAGLAEAPRWTSAEILAEEPPVSVARAESHRRTGRGVLIPSSQT